MLEREGPEALSMRRLASALGVSPMGLYNHIRDKQDLVDGITQALVAELKPIPAETTEWRERLRFIFRSLRKICLQNAAVIPLVESAEVLGQEFFRPMEAALAALREVGLSPEEALRAYYALANFTMGQISYQIRGPFRGMDPTAAIRRRTIPAEDFPQIVEAASGREWDFDAAFEFGLEIFLDGLVARVQQDVGRS